MLVFLVEGRRSALLERGGLIVIFRVVEGDHDVFAGDPVLEIGGGEDVAHGLPGRRRAVIRAGEEEE